MQNTLQNKNNIPVNPEQSSNHVPSNIFFSKPPICLRRHVFRLYLQHFLLTSSPPPLSPPSSPNSWNLRTSDPRARTRPKCGSRRPSPPWRPSPCSQLWESLEGEEHYLLLFRQIHVCAFVLWRMSTIYCFLNKFMFVLLCFRWPQAKPNLCWDVQTSSAARSREYYWIEV